MKPAPEMAPQLAASTPAQETPVGNGRGFSFEQNWPELNNRVTYPRGSLWLPPCEYWLIDPDRDKLPTPVDERGIVDAHTLIECVKLCIDPAYEWNSPPDVHHLNWPACDYEYIEERFPQIPATQYRNLVINTLTIPRTFHNVIHRFTLPPVMPDAEVMRYRIEAWRVGNYLLSSAAHAAKMEQLYTGRLAIMGLEEEQAAVDDAMAHEIAHDIKERHFKGMSRHLRALEAVPQEFWPISEDTFRRLADHDLTAVHPLKRPAATGLSKVA